MTLLFHCLDELRNDRAGGKQSWFAVVTISRRSEGRRRIEPRGVITRAYRFV